MKVKNFKPLIEPVEDDGGNVYELRSPGEDAYCAWEDAKLLQVKFHNCDKCGNRGGIVEHTALNRSIRSLLVGECLYVKKVEAHNAPEGWIDPKPVGEAFVRERFQPESITRMYEWCYEAGGFGKAAGDAKNSSGAAAGPSGSLKS